MTVPLPAVKQSIGHPAKAMRQRAPQARTTITQQSLLAAARTLFARSGYHATRTSDLVALTSMSRGALYHNFSSKQGLFEAVFREVAAELHADASNSVAALHGDTWGQLVGALQTYLGLVAARPEVQKILLIDGPSVLGWQRARDLQSEHVLRGVVLTLGMLIASGVILDQPKEPLALLMLAALNDAALAIAHTADHEAARHDMTRALTNLLQGLRQPYTTPA